MDFEEQTLILYIFIGTPKREGFAQPNRIATVPFSYNGTYIYIQSPTNEDSHLYILVNPLSF